jgi:hypothetical protein
VDHLATISGRIIMKTLLKIILIPVFVCIAGIPSSAGQESSGTVTITYILHKIPMIASNQIAVWIENTDGGYVKTLFATQWGARGGFKKRPQALPEWVKKSDWVNRSQTEVDAVSGATQQAGANELVWDLTDSTGKPVAAGTYIYKIEGIIYWKNRVVWQGRIDVGSGEGNTSMATATYFPPEAAKVVITTREGKEQIIENGLVKQVKAIYTPPR